MNINNFEQKVSRIILARGLGYYQNGNVYDVEHQGHFTYSLLVEGSDNYEVIVRLDANSTILFSKCDCPYDMGDTCKHEVAAYYKLRDLNDEDTLPSKKKNDLEDVLSYLPKEKLVEIIMEMSRKDRAMRDKLLFNYSNEGSSQGFIQFENLIDEIVEKHKGRDGFITYWDTNDFVHDLEELLEMVKDVDGNHFLALDMAGALLITSIDAMTHYADDSDGSLGSFAEQTIFYIEEIAMMIHGFDEEDEYLDKMITLSENKIFDGWVNFQIELLAVGLVFISHEEIRFKLNGKLESLLSTPTEDYYSKYRKEEILKIQYALLLGSNEANDEREDFVKANLEYTFFREELIEQSMELKDYQKVLTLAIDGEAQDKEYRGLLSKWKVYRYAAYKGLSMKDEQKKLGRELLFGGEIDYYQELKALNPGREKELYEEIKLELKQAGGFHTNRVYLQLVEEENDVDEMLVYVKENPMAIESYAKKLLNDHEEIVIQLFTSKIMTEAKASSNRKEYQKVCATLNRFKKVAGQTHQDELISKLSLLYNRKPAFLDELSKIGSK